MKITRVRSVFSGNNHYVVVETDEGIRGLGEATLNTRQLAVEGALRHMEAYLKGKDPLRSAFLWQDVFRGTFWRGGPVLQAALSGVDLALWDLKGKALNVPVYQLLGGKCRDKVRLYKGIGGRDERQAGQALEQALKAGYKAIRICPHDNLSSGYYDQNLQVRLSERWMRFYRQEAGEDVDIVFECHTRLSPAYATELCNRIAPYHPFFVEDPLRADSPEAYRTLRERTTVALGTGEKFGAKWDYRCLVENDLVDYLRTDICNCGGITEMVKIAAIGELHYMHMVPHGVPLAGMMATLHCDLAMANFHTQENWLPDTPPAHLRCQYEVKDGFATISDAPGLGVELVEENAEPFELREHPHWRASDGSVQDW